MRLRYLLSFPTRRSSDLFEDGLQLRDFVNVRDIVQANLLAMESSGGDGMALNVGSGEPVSVRQVAMEIRSEEHTSELQSRFDLVCRLLLEKRTTRRATRS